MDGKRRIAPPTGTFTRGQKVLLVDDVIAKADSKLEAIETLRNSGLVVAHVVVLVDREQGGREAIKPYDCTLHTVFTMAELLDLYVETGRMTKALREQVHEYLATPR